MNAPVLLTKDNSVKMIFVTFISMYDNIFFPWPNGNPQVSAAQLKISFPLLKLAQEEKCTAQCQIKDQRSQFCKQNISGRSHG